MSKTIIIVNQFQQSGFMAYYHHNQLFTQSFEANDKILEEVDTVFIVKQNKDWYNLKVDDKIDDITINGKCYQSYYYNGKINVDDVVVEYNKKENKFIKFQ